MDLEIVWSACVRVRTWEIGETHGHLRIMDAYFTLRAGNTICVREHGCGSMYAHCLHAYSARVQARSYLHVHIHVKLQGGYMLTQPRHLPVAWIDNHEPQIACDNSSLRLPH